MAKFVLMTEVKTLREIAEWWECQNDTETEVQLFESFDEAKLATRKTIRRLTRKHDFFPLKRGGGYAPLEQFAHGYDEDLTLLAKIVRYTLGKPEYVYENPSSLDIRATDDGDHYIAFVGTKDLILAEYYGQTLRMNVHNMSDPKNDYFFTYKDSDESDIPTCEISVRLCPVGKIKKKHERKALPKNYETVTFGRYMQDADGETLTPLSWRVLEKRGDMTLLITEKVVDHQQFAANESNDWETSDIRKWLNTEFADRAFDEQEKQQIGEVTKGERIFLLDFDEYLEYFPSPDDARAEYTDYTRSKAYVGTVREPYAFWWLRAPNSDDDWDEDSNVYLYHVCNNGTLNPFERAEYRDGVRPVLWVRSDDLTA